MMIDMNAAKAFAAEWIAAWNAHDLDRILSHYSFDIVLLSPIAQRLAGNGRVEGLAALKNYWSAGLAAQPELKFELIETMLGYSSLTIVYRNHRGMKATETFEFEPGGNVVRSIACYS
ncbi:MAG: nuclear transport factor 2 family protein [Pseudomonadota bacterium]